MIRRLLVLGLVALSGLLFSAGPVAAAPESSDPVHLDVRVNGGPVAGGRFVLDPRRPATVSVTVRNPGGAAARVRTVRMTGTALALTFFAYETSVVLDVAPGTTETREFTLDLSDLSSQVTGLIPTTVSVLGTDRQVLAAASATADVQGSVFSVYGVFGLGVLFLTLFSWAAGLWALARRRLPPNRWRRAMRFVPAGVGTGLVAVVTLSVLRLVAPAPAAEIPMVLGAAAAAFILGYLTLPPEEADADEEQPADPAGQAAAPQPLAAAGAFPGGPFPAGPLPAASPADPAPADGQPTLAGPLPFEPTAPFVPPGVLFPPPAPFAPSGPPPFPPGPPFPSDSAFAPGPTAPAAPSPASVAAAADVTVTAFSPAAETVVVEPDGEATIRLDPPPPGRLP